MNTADEKKEAREAALRRRRKAHGAGLDGAGQRRLQEFLAPFLGRPLAGYMPIRSEINPLPVMAAWQGEVAVPVIRAAGQPLEFHRWTSATKMIDGPFGASVPEEGVSVTPEVLIVPLVAFDLDGFRLGYGGGFYDRTLARLRAAGPVMAIGFAYAAQVQQAVPREETDQRLDAVVTDEGVYRFG